MQCSINQIVSLQPLGPCDEESGLIGDSMDIWIDVHWIMYPSMYS